MTTFSMSRGKLLLGLGGWMVLCFLAASLGALFMPGAWYAALQKPSWNPPGWVFGPVWSVLYTLMAIAAWLAWKQGGFAAQGKPLSVFLFQLALNAAWSPIFFGLQRPDLAFAVILLLWLAIVATGWTFRPVSRPAAWLLVPYLAWVSFATVLNGTLWWLNA